jgi:hypothetical protein
VPANRPSIKEITFYKITRPRQTMARQPGSYIGIVPHLQAPVNGSARRIKTRGLEAIDGGQTPAAPSHGAAPT